MRSNQVRHQRTAALGQWLDALWRIDRVRAPRAGRMSRRQLAFALMAVVVVVLASVMYELHVAHLTPERIFDFDQLYVGASAMLNDLDPYALVGPGRELPQRWNLYYPAPALVAAAPLTIFSLDVARTIFVAGGAALFAVALAWRGGSRARWLVFISGSWQTTVYLAQASGYLAAAFLLPWVGVILIAKPNMGIVVMSAARRYRDLWWPIGGGLLLLLISFVLQAGWIDSWLVAISENKMRSAPVTRPLGFLLLLAVTKWRRPEARLLLAMSLVSQTPHMYDLLLLFLVPIAALEHVALVVLSQAALTRALADGSVTEVNAWIVVYGELTIVYMFLPCLLMLLRRPNEGPAPAWLESRIAHWPSWLRGRPVALPA